MSQQNPKEAYFKSLTEAERATALRENAVTNYTKNVVRNFTEEEITDMKSELSEVAIKLSDLEKEKKDLTAQLNEVIKPVKDAHSLLVTDLKNKYYEKEEVVYDIDEQETGTMYTFDAQGNLLGTRRLTPKERQTTIKNLNTGTHD